MTQTTGCSAGDTASTVCDECLVERMLNVHIQMNEDWKISHENIGRLSATTIVPAAPRDPRVPTGVTRL